MFPRLIFPPLFVLAIAGVVQAQSPAPTQSVSAAPPTAVFDVAAIHPHIPEPHEHNSIVSSPFDGNFKAENMSVVMLIHWAYEIPETRIVGAPGWAGSTFFNIDADADPSVDQQMRNLAADAGRKMKEQMVRALLEDRFKLVTHTETRELPVYSLIVAKGGARLGPIQPDGSSISTSNGRIDVRMANSVAILAEELSKVVGRDVVDQTGIAGRYDLKLRWTPDGSASAAFISSTAPPSIFTALEEQLGLKLLPQKGPVQVLVIDHVELPSPN